MRWSRTEASLALIERAIFDIENMRRLEAMIVPTHSIPIGAPGEQTFVRGWRWVTYADDGFHSWIVRGGVEIPCAF